MRRAFTLVEMLVAIAVLLAVIVATAKIFSIASKVSSSGEAVASVTQQASVLKEQMERDLARISKDGFIAIQCVAVRNDVRQVLAGNGGAPDPSAPLLVPDPPLDLTDAEIAALGGIENAKRQYVVRCDQIVFFTTGSEQSARWAGPGDLAASGGGQRSRGARIYYGHGVQFPEVTNDVANYGADVTSNEKPIITGIEGAAPAGIRQVTPWSYSALPAISGPYLGLAYGGNTTGAATLRFPFSQPEARQWVLARRSVLLADDAGSAWYYPDPMQSPSASGLTIAPDPSSAPSIFGDRSHGFANGYPMELRGRDWVPTSANLVPSQMIQSGWVDIAASDLDAVRRLVAPTMPLPPQAPFTVWDGGSSSRWRLSSLVPPWAGFDPPGPLGWPLGAGTVGYPGRGGPSAALDPGASNFGSISSPGANPVYSTQRDRILRGCFGISAQGALPGSPATGLRPGLLGWPRAERTVANLSRRTEVLTAPVLLTNCSSFRIDWTWRPKVGEAVDSTGRQLAVTDRVTVVSETTQPGSPPTVRIEGNLVATMSGFDPWVQAATGPLPWFGYPDDGGPSIAPAPIVAPLQAQRLGATLAQRYIDANIDPDEDIPFARNVHMSVVARAIEGDASAVASSGALDRHPAITAPFGAAIPVRVYSAVFGFNSAEQSVTRQGDKFTAYLTVYDTNRDGVLQESEALIPGSAISEAQFSDWNIVSSGGAGNEEVTRTEFDGRQAARVLRDDFTPWPSQLRVTAVIHDPRLTLGRGREVQFVLEVPNRGSE